ncbi:MAG: dienelactone hydrolase family protein [Pseudomonas sp.]
MFKPQYRKLDVADVDLSADLRLPTNAVGLVVFVHGSGSSRSSPRNQQVAQYLSERGLGTLLFDLLTDEEQVLDRLTRELRFDIPLLTRRLVGVIDWIERSTELRPLRIGLFGASTGAAAALLAAVERPDVVHAVVSRGGRTDLAGSALAQVKAPTLQIVGGEDLQVLDMNRESADALHCEQRLEVVAGATHLFEEPGTLEEVARLAGDWFEAHLRTPVTKTPSR